MIDELRRLHELIWFDALGWKAFEASYIKHYAKQKRQRKVSLAEKTIFSSSTSNTDRFVVLKATHEDLREWFSIFGFDCSFLPAVDCDRGFGIEFTEGRIHRLKYYYELYSDPFSGSEKKVILHKIAKSLGFTVSLPDEENIDIIGVDFTHSGHDLKVYCGPYSYAQASQYLPSYLIERLRSFKHLAKSYIIMHRLNKKSIRVDVEIDESLPEELIKIFGERAVWLNDHLGPNPEVPYISFESDGNTNIYFHPALKDARFTTKDDFTQPLKDTPYAWACTSGSTGNNVLIPISRSAYDAKLRRAKLVFERSNCPKETMINLATYHVHNSAFSTHEGAREYGLTVIPVGDVESPQLSDIISSTKPSILFGYTYVLKEFVQRMFHPIKRAYLTGQPIHPKYRQRFNADIYNVYGISEVGVIAAQQEPDGPLTIIDDGLILEVLIDDNILKEGKGELLVTDIHNTCIPIKRYKTGDLVEINGKQLRLFGRLDDYENIGGSLINRQTLVQTVQDILQHEDFLIVLEQDSSRGMSRVVIHLPPRDFAKIEEVEAVVTILGETPIVKTSSIQPPRTSTGKIQHLIVRSLQD